MIATRIICFLGESLNNCWIVNIYLLINNAQELSSDECKPSPVIYNFLFRYVLHSLSLSPSLSLWALREFKRVGNHNILLSFSFPDLNECEEKI